MNNYVNLFRFLLKKKRRWDLGLFDSSVKKLFASYYGHSIYGMKKGF